MSDTRTNIAAVLTPRGAAALAVVRVAGPAVASWLAARFSRPIVASRPVHGQLRDEGGQVIDDPVAVLAPGGKFVDLCLHGGAWIVESTLALLRRDGFTIVDAAEAVYEAESALEAEILGALPRATTDLALRCLLAQGDAWARLASEHGVTFDGVFTAARPESPAGPLRDRLRAIAADEALWWLLHPPTVAIVGAPNVGKSTLANRLLGRERSIVADLPGTTRDWVGERADLAGLPVLLADTPGIRRTEDAIESAAIRQAAGIVAGADLLLLVLDATRPLSEQQPAIDQCSRAIRVVNKCDVAPTGLSAGGVGVSARTGQGIDALIEQIHRRFGVWELDPDEPRWWTAAQRDRLRQIG